MWLTATILRDDLEKKKKKFLIFVFMHKCNSSFDISVTAQWKPAARAELKHTVWTPPLSEQHTEVASCFLSSGSWFCSATRCCERSKWTPLSYKNRGRCIWIQKWAETYTCQEELRCLRILMTIGDLNACVFFFFFFFQKGSASPQEWQLGLS